MDEYVEQGRRLQSVWTDILPSKTGNEILGYPTQKPEKLIERILQASSNSGDLVADFYWVRYITCYGRKNGKKMDCL